MAVDPQFLCTAIEAVVHAGDLQMARFGRDMRVDKKGAIDLVTEADVASGSDEDRLACRGVLAQNKMTQTPTEKRRFVS